MREILELDCNEICNISGGMDWGSFIGGAVRLGFNIKSIFTGDASVLDTIASCASGACSIRDILAAFQK